ncbi:MAG: hypothetical protein HQL94_01480 [Magnetococcales bacterium]|nr:hypothetical protein [Magnetococcales bacterium]MBF0439051.1 hypothetical protein [Magnetococcales bacterium]
METVKQILAQQATFEADGRQAMGVHLTPELAKVIRWELHQYYGSDPGEQLTTLYGMEILSMDAKELRFTS